MLAAARLALAALLGAPLVIGQGPGARPPAGPDPQGPARQEADGAGEIRIVANGTRRTVRIGEDLFTEYRYDDAEAPQPILYPVLGPGQRAMMRHYPYVERREAEATDHRHHRSLWFVHGDVNGYDFWHSTHSKDVIEHIAYLPVEGARASRTVHTRNRWRGHDDVVVCTDDRILEFGVHEDGRVRWLDYTIVIHASHGPVTFGDTKEGSMSFRMAPTLRLKGEVAQGRAINSEGVAGREVWGKRAAWVAYHGPIDGVTMGVALLDHPGNPRHPTWWYARDYGLLAANPFGVHDFEKKPAGTGDLTLPEGEDLRFRYRFLFFEGDAAAVDVGTRYAEWTATYRGHHHDDGHGRDGDRPDRKKETR